MIKQYCYNSCIGSNDITQYNHKHVDVQDIAKIIIQIDIQCKSGGVTEVFINFLDSNQIQPLNWPFKVRDRARAPPHMHLSLPR